MIDNNLLDDIQEDFFDAFPRLKTLSLGYNPLPNLEARAQILRKKIRTVLTKNNE